jgi:hypothetical protein
MNTELTALIDSTKGRFFTIKFIKKDGTVRVANGKDRYRRLFASRDSARAGVSTVAEAGYKSFVDRNKESWIAAKDENLLHFKCGAIEKHFSV